MKTSVTKKESPGNLEEILRVKPKVEIVYQAIKYTGDNIHDIYRIFNGREIQFKVEDGWDGNLLLKIKDHNANYYLTVGKYIIFSYYVNQDIPNNVCIRTVAENINEIKNKFEIISFDKPMHNLSIRPTVREGFRALPFNWKTVNIFLDLFFTGNYIANLSTYRGDRLVLNVSEISCDGVKLHQNNYIVFRFRPDRSISIIEYDLSPIEFQERYKIVEEKVK